MPYVASRPLVAAGPAAVAGVWLAAQPGPWTAVCAALLAARLATRRSAAAFLALAALLAGHGAGARLEATVRHVLAGSGEPWPRAPPAPALCELSVEECDEDPFRGRAWLQGRRHGGGGVLCVWPGALPAGVAKGARVRVAGRFRPPHPPGNPGEDDSRRALAARGIALVADLRTQDNVEVLAPAGPGPALWVRSARRAAAERLRRSLPADVAPLAAALLLGMRSGLSPEDRALFERTGTMHVLAISGMHVLLMAGVIHRLLRACGLGLRAAAGVTLLLALAYVPVAGGAAPIRRAVAMLSFYALALVRGRPADPGSALGGAALVLSLADPAEVSRVGFRLSFAAAAGIAWLARPWQERWSRRHRLLLRFPAVRSDRPLRNLAWGYVLRATPVALAAWCATQGLVADAFGVATPVAPLANLVVGPLLALVLPLFALVACGLGFCAGPAAWAARLLRMALDPVARVPGGFLCLVPAPGWSVALWCAGCVLLRPRPLWGMACCGVAAAAFLAPPPPAPPSLVLLDVGHGQAALLRMGDGADVLVDAGSRGRPEIARRTLVPALRSLGVHRLDAVVCTHADADHWNGIPALLDRFPVGCVHVGARPSVELQRAARRRGVPVRRLGDGQVVASSSVARLLCLAADGAADASGNDRSTVLLFEARGSRVLLPADREEAGLRDLLHRGVPRCAILLAPHHGARCNEAARLGAAVRPRLLLVSTARGFSHGATLRAYGAPDVRSTEQGCIEVGFPDEGRFTVAPPRRP